ncbi:MAG: hypothetical protein SOW59_00815 [Corynebacterium sp.]|nr:hypothetical protein [Corynebacterium sp.]
MKKATGITLALVLALLLGLVAGGAFMVWRTAATLQDPTDVVVEDRSAQVIESVKREEQVVLLSLGIQGLRERGQSTEVFGLRVPGSDRAVFMEYNFDAKLGLEGKDVDVRHTGNNNYEITAPNFIFIGNDDVDFRLVTENNGVLSFVTPEVSQAELFNEVLSLEAQQQYVNENRAVLLEQATTFYESIIHAVDPDATVTVKVGSKK